MENSVLRQQLQITKMQAITINYLLGECETSSHLSHFSSTDAAIISSFLSAFLGFAWKERV